MVKHQAGYKFGLMHVSIVHMNSIELYVGVSHSGTISVYELLFFQYNAIMSTCFIVKGSSDKGQLCQQEGKYFKRDVGNW